MTMSASRRGSLHALAALLASSVACTSSDPETRPARTSERVASAGPAPLVAGVGARHCPVPVCRYEGTGWEEMVFGRDEPGSEFTIRGDATVAWTFSHREGRDAVYVATGEVRAQWTGDHCAITLSPAAYTFDRASNRSGLRVDFTTDPVTYTGSGFAEWDAVQHWSCQPDSEWSDPDGGAHAGWFHGEGTAGREGFGLEGSFEAADRRSGWSFRAVH